MVGGLENSNFFELVLSEGSRQTLEITAAGVTYWVY